MKSKILIALFFFVIAGLTRGSAPINNSTDPVVVLRVYGLRDLSEYYGMWSTLYWLNGMQHEADLCRGYSNAYASLVPAEYTPTPYPPLDPQPTTP